MAKRVLALVIIIALLPVQAFAAPDSGIKPYEAYSAVDAAMYVYNSYVSGAKEIAVSAPQNADMAAFVTNVYYYFRMLYAEYSIFYYYVSGRTLYIEPSLDGLDYERQEAEKAAETIVAAIITPDMSQREKILAIHDYILANCEYDYQAARNPLDSRKTAYTSYGALIKKIAVCDGYSAAMALLCRKAGIPCIYILSDEMNHSWNAVILGGSVLYIDSTYNDTGNVYQTHDYFLLSSDQMTQMGHKWDKVFSDALISSLWSMEYRAAHALSTIGLFRGTPQGFELERNPLRSESGIMLLRFMGLEEEAKTVGKGLVCPFTDVIAYYQPYIAYMAQNGITKGTSDTTYSPDDFISASQYVTFILRTLGYSDSDNEFNWKTAIEFAVDAGVITPEDGQYLFNNQFSRGSMAYISYVMLFASRKDGVTVLEYLIDLGTVNEKIAEDLLAFSVKTV